MCSSITGHTLRIAVSVVGKFHCACDGHCATVSFVSGELKVVICRAAQGDVKGCLMGEGL